MIKKALLSTYNTSLSSKKTPLSKPIAIKEPEDADEQVIFQKNDSLEKPSSIILSLTENAKSQIATMVYEEVKLKDGFYEDANVTSYLESLISEINTKMELSDSPNKVKVINSKEENAFVTTDKYVYITKGLLKALDTEEEILAVFAHELGHAKLKHLEKTYEKDEALQKNGVNQLVTFILKNEYSKECEFQADQFAVDSLIKMGRNPAGVRSLFGHIKEKEEKTDKMGETERFAIRLIRTHPYASERLERACTLINHDLANIKDNSLRLKGCKLEEEEFIKNLTGTFDEKLSKFNERYPDGKDGRIDQEAQFALFKYVSKDGATISNLQDERGEQLNLFTKEHAETVEDFQKIFQSHKIFHGANIETFLVNMTQGKDKIKEIENLWKCDFPNNFLAYGYPDFDAYTKEDYSTRSIREKSEIIGDLSQKHYWAKVFGFRCFVREHIFKDINTREELKRILDLPFMKMDIINILSLREKKFADLTNSVHSQSLYKLAKKVYKNETGNETFDTGFMKFAADLFGKGKVDMMFLSNMCDDSESYYKKLKEDNKISEFHETMRGFVNKFQDPDSKKTFMSNIRFVLMRQDADNFKESFCQIFNESSQMRDDILFDVLTRTFTFSSLKSYLSYFTLPLQEKIKKIMGNSKELTFEQRLNIIEEFYSERSLNEISDCYEYEDAMSNLNSRHSEKPEDIINIFKSYARKRRQTEKLSYFYVAENKILKLLHPANLQNLYGSNFLKQVNTAVKLLNCLTRVISPGIGVILHLAYNNAMKSIDIDNTFSSMKSIRKDYFSSRTTCKVQLGELLEKGIEYLSKENNADFSKIFDGVNKWYSLLKNKAGDGFISYTLNELAGIIEEKTLLALKKYGKDSVDAVKVIAEFRKHRLETKNKESLLDKVKKIKESLESEYDKNLAMAGYIGYFKDKNIGRIPQDINRHLNLIELLMPEPTPLRNDVLTELLSNQVLTDSAKIRISDLLYSYKEKDNIKLNLYRSKVNEDNMDETLPYKEQIDILEKYFNEPSRSRDKILTELENKHAQSINETKYSSHLKFDNCNEKDIAESTYFKENKYLLDPKNRVQAIALTSSGSIINILLRYFKGSQSDEKDQSDEEKTLYKTISNLEPIDRKNIIKEMLVGLEAFEKEHLKDIKLENRTGGFSVKAWKEEFISKIIDSLFKEGKNSNDNNFVTWLIKEIFNEANLDRSASIISELIEAKTSNLKEEEAMFHFLNACGPIARKLGQILSSNSLVPEKYQNEFAKLKLSLDTPLSKEDVIRIIKSELDGKIADGLGGIHIDGIEKLLGSASIRTVYKVRMNGKEYVAKINDPQSREMAIEDLEILDKLSKKLEESPELLNKFKIQNPKLLLHNLTLCLFQDIDSRIEKINSKKIENVITQEGNHTSNIFYAGPNVVLEELVDGKGLHKGIDEFKLDRDNVLDKLLTSYAAQVDKGIFHADPHSENIMVTRSGEVYWIDKSMLGDFTKDNLSSLEKNAVFDILFDIGLFGHFNVFHGITTGLIMKHLEEMAKVKPSGEEKEKIKSNILDALKKKDKSPSEKFYEINNAAERGGYVFSDNVFMFGKSIITLSGEVKKINPHADLGKYLRKVILRDEVKRSFSDMYHWFFGSHEEESDFLKDNGIGNLASIPWEKLTDERKISKELLGAAKIEFKDIKSKEEAVSALKQIFLRHGQNLTIQDIEFINNTLKTTQTLKTLQQQKVA